LNIKNLAWSDPAIHAIALASVLAGLGAAIMAIKGRLRGDSHSHWWIGSALILAIPAIAVLFLA